MYALSVLAFFLALVLGGVALLLWSTLPMHEAPHAWVLPVLPVACLLASGLCWWGARQQRLQPWLQEIRAQLALDLQAIRPVQSV